MSIIGPNYELFGDIDKAYENFIQEVMAVIDILHLHIFLLDTQCTSCCIENRSVKRANSHCTICSLLTLTHIIF